MSEELSDRDMASDLYRDARLMDECGYLHIGTVMRRGAKRLEDHWKNNQAGGSVTIPRAQHKAMKDPTYDRDQINANPVWELAFVLSEIQNDGAPIGWSKYIWIAECLLSHYDIKPKARAAGINPSFDKR